MSKIPYQIKLIPGFPGYFADTNGDIWSVKSDSTCKDKHFSQRKKLKGYIERNGYRRFCLSRDGKSRASGHRLILETFVGKCPPGMQACHNNGNKLDNRPENLRWDTSKNNCADTIRHGTHRSLHQEGEKNLYSKLTEDQVKTIRFIYKNYNVTQEQLGRAFGVWQVHISKIVNYKIWKHL